MNLTLRILQEDDGRWFGVVDALPGVMAYGATPEEATAKTQALAYWRLADMLDAGELASADDVHFERAA
jgi:predicted RNase H-like HicB family nuclease